MEIARINSIIPQLPSLDFKKSKPFYQDFLGFLLQKEFPDLLIFLRDDCELHLWRCDDPEIPKASSCYIRVQNIAHYFQRLSSALHPKGKLEDKPWGMREFYLLDDSGNLLKFGEPIL